MFATVGAEHTPVAPYHSHAVQLSKHEADTSFVSCRPVFVPPAYCHEPKNKMNSSDEDNNNNNNNNSCTTTTTTTTTTDNNNNNNSFYFTNSNGQAGPSGRAV